MTACERGVNKQIDIRKGGLLKKADPLNPAIAGPELQALPCSNQPHY